MCKGNGTLLCKAFACKAQLFFYGSILLVFPFKLSSQFDWVSCVAGHVCVFAVQFKLIRFDNNMLIDGIHER